MEIEDIALVEPKVENVTTAGPGRVLFKTAHNLFIKGHEISASRVLEDIDRDHHVIDIKWLEIQQAAVFITATTFCYYTFGEEKVVKKRVRYDSFRWPNPTPICLHVEHGNIIRVTCKDCEIMIDVTDVNAGGNLRCEWYHKPLSLTAQNDLTLAKDFPNHVYLRHITPEKILLASFDHYDQTDDELTVLARKYPLDFAWFAVYDTALESSCYFQFHPQGSSLARVILHGDLVVAEYSRDNPLDSVINVWNTLELSNTIREIPPHLLLNNVIDQDTFLVTHLIHPPMDIPPIGTYRVPMRPILPLPKTSIKLLRLKEDTEALFGDIKNAA